MKEKYTASLGMLRKPFIDLKEANAEIIKLRDEIHRLHLANALLQKKPRGRPPKSKGFKFSILFGLGGTNSRMLPKNKGGRTKNHTKAEMIENLEMLDYWKEKLKKDLSLSKITDKKAITILVEEEFKNERSDKKDLHIKRIISVFKYFRDETGIRQCSNKSGKPPK